MARKRKKNIFWGKKFERVRSVRAVLSAAGHLYSLVLSAAVHLYSFGLGLYGRLGHGDYAEQPRPVRIEALRPGLKRYSVSID